MALAAVASTATSADSVWTSSGPYGGQVFDIAASPLEPGVYLAVTAGGVFQSIDRGATWSREFGGDLLGFPQLVYSRTVPGLVVGRSGSRIVVSEDSGRTWQDRTPPDSIPFRSLSDALAFSSSADGEIVVGRLAGEVLYSPNRGLDWELLPLPQGSIGYVSAIGSNPFSESEFLVAGEGAGGGIWRLSLDAGQPQWTEIPCTTSACPWFNRTIKDIDWDRFGKVWVLAGDTVISGSADGSQWNEVRKFDEFGASELDVGYQNAVTLFVAGIGGVAFSTDEGASWSFRRSDFIANGLGQQDWVRNVVIDPFEPGVQMVGSRSGGIYIRDDSSGQTFIKSNLGLNAHSVRAIDVRSGLRIHAGISDVFLPSAPHFLSIDAGSSWSSRSDGLNADHFRALKSDPNSPDVLYAGGVSLSRETEGIIYPGNGGLYKSEDAGMSWSTIDQGIPSGPAPSLESLFGTVRDIEIDPFSANGSGESQVIYAGGDGYFGLTGSGPQQAARIYKSSDAGATWIASDTGLGGTESGGFGRVFVAVSQIVLDTADPTGNTLFVSTFFPSTTETDQLSIQNGVFKTVDGGQNWVNVSEGLPRLNDIPGNPAADVYSLVQDPTDPTGSTLYASVNGRVSGFEGVIYRSTDGGDSWQFFGEGLGHQDVRDLVVDPESGDLYAAVSAPGLFGYGGVFLRESGGNRWVSMNRGMPRDADALKLAIDSSGQQPVLYAGTKRGVHQYVILADAELDGSPDVDESSAPNAGDGNGDGIEDALQPRVASLLSAPSLPGAAPVRITAVLSPLDGACPGFEDAIELGFLEQVADDPGLESPFGGVHFRIPDCERASIQLIHHGADFEQTSYVMRAHGVLSADALQSEWIDLPATVDQVTWTFELEDGSAADSTDDDGIIVFRGAAKRTIQVIFADGMESNG